AVAIAFAREGADIALSYLPTEEEDAQHVKSVIEQSGRKAVLLPGDLAEPDFCWQVVEDAALELGGLDALVNNAGRQIAIEQFEDLSDEQWTHTFEVNIHAIYRIRSEERRGGTDCRGWAGATAARATRETRE